ncbi:MAG: glycosyltransferase, partial [Nitrospinales bacterium]
MVSQVELSIVVPVYNEEPVIREFYPRLKEVCRGLGKSCELLFVDDGSTDNTLK